MCSHSWKRQDFLLPWFPGLSQHRVNTKDHRSVSMVLKTNEYLYKILEGSVTERGIGYYMVQHKEDSAKKNSLIHLPVRFQASRWWLKIAPLLESSLLLLGLLTHPSPLSPSHHISPTLKPSDAFFTSLLSSLQRTLSGAQLAPLSSFTSSFLPLPLSANGALVGRADNEASFLTVLNFTWVLCSE